MMRGTDTAQAIANGQNIPFGVSVVLFGYIAYLVFYEKDPLKQGICNHEYEFPQNSITIATCMVAIFFFSILIQLKRLLFSWINGDDSGTFVAIYTSTSINSIACLTYLHILRVSPNRYCRDFFGVMIHRAMYEEWLFTAPLLGYATVVPYDGAPLGPNELGVIISLALSMVCLVCYQIISMPLTLEFIFFLVAVFLNGVFYYFLYRSHKSDSSKAVQVELPTTTLKYQLSVTLACLIPLYPALYTAAALDLFHKDTIFLLLCLSDVVLKGIFAHTALDFHLSAQRSMKVQIRALSEASHTRHVFLKFLLHEIGVPLNSIAMGSDWIGRICTESVANGGITGTELNGTISEVVNDMQLATASIVDMLNNCNVHQQLEENKYTLHTEEFVLVEMLADIQGLVRLQLKENTVRFKISGSVPSVVKANKQHLALFIVHLIVHRVKHVESVCDVSLEIKSSIMASGANSICELNFIIKDMGRPLGCEEAENMFSAFSKLDTVDENNAVSFSTLRLSIGREILRIHGGSVDIAPSSGMKGNIIIVRVPFEIIANNPNGALDDQVRYYDTDAGNNLHTRNGPDSYLIDAVAPTAIRDVKRAELDVRDRLKNNWVDVRPRIERNSLSPVVPAGASPINSFSSVVAGKQPLANRFSFDCQVSTSSAVAKGDSVGSQHSTSSYLLRKRNDKVLSILVVDDAPSNRKMLQRLLANCSVSSDSACDGQQAIVMYDTASSDYDLIFMDYTMPNMNGVDATRLLRQKGYNNAVVAVTANMMLEDFQEFYEAGADLVVSKPIKISTVKKILDCFFQSEDACKSLRNMKQFF